MTPASAYKNPHHVMLFFEENQVNDTCMAERAAYYQHLRRMGKFC